MQAITSWADIAFSSTERDRHLEIRPVSQLNTWPMVSPVNASRRPSRDAAHHSGSGRMASPFPVGDFHLLFFASFPGAHRCGSFAPICSAVALFRFAINSGLAASFLLVSWPGRLRKSQGSRKDWGYISATHVSARATRGLVQVPLGGEILERTPRGPDAAVVINYSQRALMKRELYAEVSARIVAELEAGAAPWIKPWSATPGANTPCNAVTNRPYSGCNVILLWMAQAAGYRTPRFLTFKQALEVGGHVRRGERGTKVYFVKSCRSATRTPRFMSLAIGPATSRGWHAICATASARELTLLRNWLPNSVQPFYAPSSRLTVICAMPAILKTGLAF
jgi:hypothetical protein